MRRSGAYVESIVAENLTKRFNGFTAVDNLSFTVEQGEIFGLLGPNGAGKTTTIRMLASLIQPTEGDAYVGGFSVRDDALRVREIIGILTENPSLYERLSARENLEFFAKAYGVDEPKTRDARIRELLEFFDLWDRRGDRAGTFSKGMKQKLAIARALVHEPRTLYLDEPTSGLDPKSAKDIRDLMERLSQREGQTILLSTHRLEDAERLCDRVMIINHGGAVSVASPQELRQRATGAHVVRVGLRELTSSLSKAVEAAEGVKALDVKEGALSVTLADEGYTPGLVRSIVDAGGHIMYVVPLEVSLEDAYLKVIGGE
jgi:ABC-2 type transport system ATP-binding protein